MTPPLHPMVFANITVTPKPANGSTLEAVVSLPNSTYVSEDVPIINGKVEFLKLTPSANYDGADITFRVDGIESETHAIFEHGTTHFNLVIEMPPTPAPKPAPQPSSIWGWIKQIIRWIMRR